MLAFSFTVSFISAVLFRACRGLGGRGGGWGKARERGQPLRGDGAVGQGHEERHCGERQHSEVLTAAKFTVLPTTPSVMWLLTGHEEIEE